MASPFRPAPTLLAQYAEYHRDRRNIATHFIGVPMIMFGSLVLLSRPGFELAGLVGSADRGCLDRGWADSREGPVPRS